MRNKRRELATECNLEEVDNNMTDGVKPRGKIKFLIFSSPMKFVLETHHSFTMAKLSCSGMMGRS